MKKLLIVEHSEIIANEISARLQDRWDVCIQCDPRDAVRSIKTEHLDAMIIDLCLPGTTGFDVLAECFPYLPPAIVALTAVTNPCVEHQAARWGVDYVFQIPFDVELVSACLGSISELQELTTKRAAQHLRALGFSAGFNGYYCLLLAIPFLKEDFSQHLHKEVYCRIAHALRLDPRAIEKAIRTSIHTAWRHRVAGVWEQYFPVDQNGQVPCPTNKEFIVTLAQRT